VLLAIDIQVDFFFIKGCQEHTEAYKMMNFSTWLTFSLLMTAIAYALFGARVFLLMRQRCLTHIQNKATAAILFIAGGMLACSEK